MPKFKNKKTHQPIHKIYLVLVVLALLIFYVVVPQLKYFNNSIATIADADYAYVILGLLFVIATYFAAAGVYVFASKAPLRFWRTTMIQVADGFTNRLLPAGAGGIATNIIYLDKELKSKVSAGLTTGLVSLIGFLGHISILLVLLLANVAFGGKLLAIKVPARSWIIFTAIAVILAGLLILRRRLGKLAPKNAMALGRMLSFIVRNPQKIAMAFFCSVILTTCYTMALFMVMQSLNVHVSLLQAFLILTFSVLAIAITPTPGGIGGVEAGITTALISIGVSANQALSVALVYRVLTYWFPLVPGLLALRYCIKKKYLSI